MKRRRNLAGRSDVHRFHVEEAARRVTRDAKRAVQLADAGESCRRVLGFLRSAEQQVGAMVAHMDQIRGDGLPKATKELVGEAADDLAEASFRFDETCLIKPKRKPRRR